MVRRLVNDVVWRNRWSYAWLLPTVGLVWAGIAAGDAPVTWGLTLSITLTYALGVVGSLTAVGLREIRVLPVTSRDLWVTTWLVSTVVITLLVSAAQNLAVIVVITVTGSSAVSPGTLLLSSVYAFAYAGACLPIAPALGYAANNIAARQPRWLWIALTILGFLLFFGCFGFPYLLAGALPLALHQFTWITGSMLVACLVMAGVGFVWTPERGGFVPAQPVKRTSAISISKARPRFADRFTGIPRIAWTQASVMLALSIGTMVGFIAYWAVVESTSDLRSFMVRGMLLPFDTGFPIGPGDDTGQVWMLGAFIAISTGSPWSQFAKQLRISPLSVHHVNGLFLMTPIVAWVCVWLVLVGTHVAITGAFPATIRPDVLVFMGGISALSNILIFRLQNTGVWWVGFTGSAGFVLNSRLVMSWSPEWIELALLAGGPTALGLAAFINHRTLTRSGSSAKAYRRAQTPFEINAQHAPR